MKRLQILVGLLAASTCASLKAETMTVNIPFNFQLGPSAMPNGQYRVEYTHSVLKMQSVDGHHTAIVLTLPKSRMKPVEQGLLEFQRYGNSYFFSGIWGPNSERGGTIAKTAREKELARLAGPTQSAGIALTRR